MRRVILSFGVVITLASFSSGVFASGRDVSQAAWERSAQESIDELARQEWQDDTLQGRTNAIPVKNQSKLNEANVYRSAYSDLLRRIKYLEGLPVQPSWELVYSGSGERHFRNFGSFSRFRMTYSYVTYGGKRHTESVEQNYGTRVGASDYDSGRQQCQGGPGPSGSASASISEVITTAFLFPDRAYDSETLSARQGCSSTSFVASITDFKVTRFEVKR